MAALNILKLDIIAGVIAAILAYLPNLFAGILILLIGLLSIDLFADYIGSLLDNMNVQMVPTYGFRLCVASLHSLSFCWHWMPCLSTQAYSTYL